MAGFRYHMRRYFSVTREEWRSILITAVVMGFVLSYNDWGGKTFNLMVGLTNLFLDTLGSFLLLTLHVVAAKSIGISYGVKVSYNKYDLGLVVGLFLSFLTFGLWPFWVNGYFTYTAIPNLRVGKFRATLVKDWEIVLIAGGAILANLFITIFFASLFLLAGGAFFQSWVKISLLIALYALIPLPLLGTINPYQVYMSRVETLEHALTGFEIFWGNPIYYFLLLGFTVGFALFTLLLGPTLWTLLLALLTAAAGWWVWHLIETLEQPY